MPKRPDFEPVLTKAGWMVSIPPAMAADGKRVRKFFSDKKKAEKLAGALRAQHHAGLRGSVMPLALAREAMAAKALLEPLGVSLMEAARMVSKMMDNPANQEVFRDRLKRVLRDGETRWSARYDADMQKIPRWIGEEGMGMRCGAMSKDTVERLLRAHGAVAPVTLATRCRYVMAAVNWTARHRKQRKIEMMTPAEVKALLEACKTPEEKWAVGLLLYAGIRPDSVDGEIMRMDWSMVGEMEIYLPQRVTKTGADRHVPVTPVLRDLLAGHPATGRATPGNWKRVWQRLRKAAGIDGKQDVARHTFASHFLAAYGEDAAKQAMGHTAGSRVLFEHYRRAVTEADGLAFFASK